MTQNAANVSVGKPKASGGVWFGSTGVAAPTDAVTPLPMGLVSGGYASDSGLVNSVSVDTSDIVAWGGDTVQTVRTTRSETFVFTFIETKEEVLKQVYGPDNVSAVGTSLTVIHNNKDLPRQLYVFEVLMSGNRVKRIVVPEAQITSVGDVSYVDGEPIGYEITLSAYPDSSGNTAYEYIAQISGS